MVNKMLKMFMLLSAVIVALMVVPVASAQTFQEVSSPADSATVSGLVTVNISVNGTAYNESSTTLNVTNVTVGITPAGGSEVIVCTNSSNVNNFTFSSWVCEFDSDAQMFDSGIYTVTAHIFGDAAGDATEENSSTSTSVLSGNQNPISDITSPSASGSVSQGFTVDATCTNASSAFLTLQTTDYTMTVSGDLGSETCAFTFPSGEPAQQSYSGMTMQSSDQNLDTTVSSSIDFVVDGASTSSSRIGSGLANALAADGEVTVGTADGGSLTISSDSASNYFGSLLNLNFVNIVFLSLAAALFLLPPFRVFMMPGLVVLLTLWLLWPILF